MEKKAIEELISSYEDESIPLIILYLRPLSVKSANLIKKGIEDTFKNRKIDFIPILTKDDDSFDGKIIKKLGLDDLTKITANKYKNSINSYSFIYIENQITKIVEDNISQINRKPNLNNISKSICDFYEKLIGQLNETTIKIIKDRVKILHLSCLNEINFDEEIYNYISEFRKDLNQAEEFKNENIKIIIDDTEEKLDHKYKIIKSE